MDCVEERLSISEEVIVETIVFENGKLIQKNQKLKYAGICYVEPMVGYENLATSMRVAGKKPEQIKYTAKFLRKLKKNSHRKYKMKSGK